MKRYLQFVNSKTGERAENPGKVEVTDMSERRVEKIERGMLMRCGPDWFVDDFEEVTAPIAPKGGLS